MDNENWAQPENPEVEAAKDAFNEAQKAEILRQKIYQYAASAVQYGNVDRNWANDWLNRLGAKPVAGEAQYQINVPIDGSYGTTVTASSRAEALEKFGQYVAKVVEAGQVRTNHCGEGVYEVTLTGGEPVFFSGPEDPEPYTGTVPGLDALRENIRQMIKDGVSGQEWGIHHAEDALAVMGLDALPAIVHKSVQVPVSGTIGLTVPVFEGDDDEAVQRAAAGVMGRTKHVYITPDEIGTIIMPRSDSASFTLVDEDDEPY